MTSAAWLLVSVCGVCLAWTITLSVLYAVILKSRRKLSRTVRNLQAEIDRLQAELIHLIRSHERSQFVIQEEEAFV